MHRSVRPSRRAFTLIELIAVITVLGILAAVALPRYFDYSDDASAAAAEGSIGGIRTALNAVYLDNRLRNAPSSSWVTALTDIADVMETGALPQGVTIQGTKLVDQEASEYDFTAETATEPAKLTKDTGGGGGGHPSVIALLLSGYLARRQRRTRADACRA